MTDYSYGYNGSVLRIKDVSLSFKDDAGQDKPVLRQVNAEIKNITRPGMQQGQVVALLGPSGIGKTQLFRLLAGLAIPGGKLAGSVFLGEQDTPTSPGQVGVVAQSYPLFDHRTVQGNLTAAGQGTKAANLAQATELLEEFDLVQHADKYPAQLSGGQRQRVAIAQQLMCSKYFMLMDEPFSGLDPLMIQRVLGLINKVTLKDEFNTTIIVTHDIGNALAAADTVWVMGRDRDAQGQPVPGAYIKHTYDLAKLGLCWHPDIRKEPLFASLSNELRDLFPTL